MNNIQEYKKRAESLLKDKASITLEGIRRLKETEYAVMERLPTGRPIADFFQLQKDTNKEIAYWMNRNIDIVTFIEGQGYEKKHSTERWQRYEKGKDVLLITEANTAFNPRTGKSQNLYDFIQEHFVKMNPKMSNTVHMIDTVLQNEGIKPFIKRNPVASVGNTAKPIAVPRDGKDFVLADYRIEALNQKNNYLVKRLISNETLNHPYFKGAIFQGNKATAPDYYNNVIYPFKVRPGDSARDMKTLLQQYGKKVVFEGKEIDKIFAPGPGKSQAVWFSNVPERVERFYVFENPLDALSHYQMYKPVNALYCATGGNPAGGQYELIRNTCAEFKVKPVLCFDNDIAGVRFDTAFIGSVKPDKIKIDAIKDEGKVFHVRISAALPQELANIDMITQAKGIQTVSRNDCSVVVEIDNTAKATSLNNYLNHYLNTGASIEKSIGKDFNDDLRDNLRQGYESIKNMSQSLKM